MEVGNWGHHPNGGTCDPNAFVLGKEHFPKLKCIGNLGNCYSCSKELKDFLRSIAKGDGNCPQWE